jgi:ferredoxin
MTSTTIFYFSGTGNSLALADLLAKHLAPAKLLPLAGLPVGTDPLPICADRVIIVAPVYSFGVPKLVKNMVRRLRFAGSPYVAAIVSCEESPGKALDFLDHELRLGAGRGLAAGWVVRMPGNYTPLSGAAAPSVVAEILEKARKRLEGEIIPAVQDRVSHALERSLPPLSWVAPLLWQGFLSWAGKSDRRYRAESTCTHCGLCAKVCPVGNITFDARGRPMWQHRCEICMACLQFCPVEAIQFFWWTKGRRRYRHPEIGAERLAAQRLPVPRHDL